MLKKKETETLTVTGQNRIGHGAVIQGDMKATGDLRIDGTINGNVSSDGKIVIGKDGYVNGNLECAAADVEGGFNGEMKVSGLLTLKNSAVLDGKVHLNKLAVEPGATFNAQCVMGANGSTPSSRNAQESAK